MACSTSLVQGNGCTGHLTYRFRCACNLSPASSVCCLTLVRRMLACVMQHEAVPSLMFQFRI